MEQSGGRAKAETCLRLEFSKLIVAFSLELFFEDLHSLTRLLRPSSIMAHFVASFRFENYKNQSFGSYAMANASIIQVSVMESR